MTTPGGVPNLPAGALTLETLQSKLQDMTTAAMRGRAAERIPGTYDGSTGGNPLNDLTPFGILTTLFAGFNSHVALADPADINGPEDLPGLLMDFIESLPVIGQFVGLFEAIMGTYDGDDPVLLEIEKFFGLIRDVLGLIGLDLDDLPTPEEVWTFIATAFLAPLDLFAIPADVQAKINEALGHMQDALDGTYVGSDPTLLAVQALAEAWLTATSPLDSSKLTGAISETLIPLLTAAKIPGLDASKITGGTFGETLIPLLTAAKIPSLDASKIGTGTFGAGLIPNLDGSKITSGSIAQARLTITSLAASVINSGTFADARIPNLNASKITAGTFTETLIPLLTQAKIPTLDQSKVSGLGTIASDASAAVGNWSSLLSGMSQSTVGTLVSDLLGTKSTASTAASDAATAASDASAAQTAAGDAQTAASSAQGTADTAQSTALATLTSLFNKLGGNNASSASKAQADAAMQALANTISSQGAAINALQNMLEGAAGFSASVPFKQPEMAVYDTAGAFTYTLPSWFNTATDSLDAIVLGAGGGGGGGTTDSSGAGTASVFRVGGVDKATGVGGASVGSGTGAHPKGWSPGNQTYLDILYEGGGEANVQQVGRAPGGGGGAGNFFGVLGKGGNAGSWDTETLAPGTLSGALTGTVGAGGAGTASGFGAADGAPGCVWLRARAAMPGSFTSMGTLLLPTYRLNTGVALTDAMTAAATWSRIPPNGASGGHILIIRANTTFTTYVYLWVKTISGVTNYEIGRVSSGTKSAWKTGTIGDSVPFNAFSLTSDDGYIYTVAINGVAFDSYNDSAHSSLLGASYRSGGWGSSDSALPGSIVQFAFLDTGTPARITSNTVATAQTTNSTSYTDLSTVGPSVTLTVPQSGEVTVDISALMAAGGIGQVPFASFALSGANTAAASDAKSIRGAGAFGRRFHLTGLTPGTTTFTMKYHTTTSGSQVATFTDRHIIVEPKP